MVVPLVVVPLLVVPHSVGASPLDDASPFMVVVALLSRAY